MAVRNRLFYGGDYNPDQWLDRPDILEKDIDMMKDAGINEVSIGIFAWAKLEPEDGKYDFDWLEKIITRLHENGIDSILATPSGARPHWLAEKYPSVLRTNAERQKDIFSGRHNHCLTSPDYRRKVFDIDRELARRFAGHPAIIGWHISNEFSGECHCELCQQAFRKYLKGKYGTIEALNHAWWTDFWSHTYDSFDQVDSPGTQILGPHGWAVKWYGETETIGLLLDWKHFITDQCCSFIRNEVTALREGGAMQPVTTNFMYQFDGYNLSDLAAEIDEISWDSYPDWYRRPHPETASDTGFNHDWMRGFKPGKPFLLMESCTGGTNWMDVTKLREPGLLAAQGLLAVAHGSDSVMYFQIRATLGGFEKFHGSVIDQYGEKDTRVFRETAAFGGMLQQISCVKGSTVDAPVAIIYDTENRWAINASKGPRNIGMDYFGEVYNAYKALRRIPVNVDVIDSRTDLSKYRIVFAPMLYAFREDTAEKLRSYVKNGGILVGGYQTGLVNTADLCYMGETPHDMTDVFGLRREEIDGLFDGEKNTGVPEPGNALGVTKPYECTTLCELVKTEGYGAEVLMTYGSNFYKGYPVFTRHAYGNGMAYYACAHMEPAFHDELIGKLLKQAGITGILGAQKAPYGLEVCSRTDGSDEYIFLQNFADEPAEIQADESWQVIAGEEIRDGKITIGKFGCSVIRR